MYEVSSENFNWWNDFFSHILQKHVLPHMGKGRPCMSCKSGEDAIILIFQFHRDLHVFRDLSGQFNEMRQTEKQNH